MPQPFTISFGAWQPDLANVAFQTMQLAIPVTVPLADAFNVRYVNGVYQSLPAIQNVSGAPALGLQCLGAMTFIDATGAAVPIAGGNSLSANYWTSGTWTSVSSGLTSVGGSTTAWNFAQFGTQVFAQPVVSSLGALNVSGVGNLFSFLPQSGSGSAIAGAPLAGVLGVVGQFLMAGDIAAPQTSVQIATGDGATVTFTATLPTLPLYAGAQSVSLKVAGSPYAGTMTAGSFTSLHGVTTTGFSGAPAIGSISPTTDSAGNTIQELAATAFAGVVTSVALQVASASALGAAYFTILSLNGPGVSNISLPASSATYAFSGGVNTWQWNSSTYGTLPSFTNTSSYSVAYSSTLSPNLQAYDNGSGTFVASAGSSFSTGTVNYETGAISLTFSSAPGSGIRVVVNFSFAARARLQWCAIGNGSNWPTPLTQTALALQAGQNDIEYAYGPVMAIAGYPLYGVIFQRNAITRASYIGGNVVFSWQTYSRDLGLLAKNAWAPVGLNVYFLSDQGFFYTDGANVIPIGTAPDNSSGIDQWFFSNVNQAAFGAIKAGYDARSRNVAFAIPTGSNTLPDTLLLYNVIAGRWTRGTCASEFIWTDSDGSSDRLGLFDQSHNYSLLTGTPATGYLESCDVQFADGMSRTTLQGRPVADGSSVTVTVGTRNSLGSAVSYTTAAAPDPFAAGFSPVLAQGQYTRGRVSSANAVSIQGATLMMQPGGPV